MENKEFLANTSKSVNGILLRLLSVSGVIFTKGISFDIIHRQKCYNSMDFMDMIEIKHSI